jgi:hypothetical protein
MKTGFDPTGLTRISHGRQHDVYVLDDTQVVKVPRRDIPEPVQTIEQIRHDLMVLQTYFPEELLDTNIVPDPYHGYLIYQHYCPHVQPITVDILDAVKPHLEELITRNRRMRRDTGTSVDFFGRKGLENTWRGLLTGNQRLFKMTNIGVIDNNKKDHEHGAGSRRDLHCSDVRLVILDTNVSILTPWVNGAFTPSRFVVDMVSYRVNQFLLKVCFGIDP